MADETEGLHDRFVKANANLEYISYQFADVLRNLIRASVAGDPRSALYNAAEKMNFVAELLSKTEEKFGFHTLFTNALQHVRKENDRESPIKDAIIRAAKSGVQFLVERSCDDNAARGRASRRQDEFLNAIHWLQQERGGRL